ncbi:hypothetical protein FQK03_07400 [Acinetobacter baumannii]|nr:hypothetical protein FQK03_07400 [Acinetobacter baumannii]
MEIKILRRILRGLGEDGFLKKYKFIKPLNTGGNSHSYKAYDRRALLHKDLKVKTSHIYSNLSDNSGMWSA